MIQESVTQNIITVQKFALLHNSGSHLAKLFLSSFQVLIHYYFNNLLIFSAISCRNIYYYSALLWYL